MKKIIIHKISSLEPEALTLIIETFMQFEAPDYSEEGVRSFKAFSNSKEQMAKLEMFGAYDDEKLVGIIAGQDGLSHICLFFVDAKHQRLGIGRKLWEHLLGNSEAARITVNSSPYAVKIYHRLGFRDLSCEQLADGMRYTPMEYLKTAK